MTGVTALVLAAGLSTRMGTANKLLADFRGRPLLVQAIHALPSAIERIIVITGPENAALRTALAAYSVDYVVNPDPAAGMGSSLAVGAALVDDRSAVLVCLGDMPLVKPTTIEALLAASATLPPTGLCVPAQSGKTGHPVLFGPSHLPALRCLAGDTGARSLLVGQAVCKVPVDDPGIFLDIDTPEMLATLAEDDYPFT